MKKKIGILFLFIFIISAFLFFFLYFQKEEKEEEYVFSVNGVVVSEREFENYRREVARDYLLNEEELTLEEQKEKAIEKGVRLKLAEEYLKENGVFPSEEEIKKEINKLALLRPGAENAEEFFQILEMQGFLQEEVKRDTAILLGYKKLAEKIKKEVEVREEEIEERYVWHEENIEEGEKMPVFEDVRGELEEEIKEVFAWQFIYEELNEKREKAEVVVF